MRSANSYIDPVGTPLACSSREALAIVARVIIVLVAFPLFAHVIFTVLKLLLDLTLPGREGDGQSATVVHAAVGAAVLVAVLGSFKICRRLWPSAPVR
jgi:hypothetical protein